MAYQGNVKKDIGENIKGNRRGMEGTFDYTPPVGFGPGKQSAPQYFSITKYNGEANKTPAANFIEDPVARHTIPDKDPRAHFQTKSREVSHNETEKEGMNPQERISEYRQKFNIASGSRSD